MFISCSLSIQGSGGPAQPVVLEVVAEDDPSHHDSLFEVAEALAGMRPPEFVAVVTRSHLMNSATADCWIPGLGGPLVLPERDCQQELCDIGEHRHLIFICSPPML